MRWRREVRWNPHDLGWRIGAVFVVGSFLFALGSFPPYFNRLDPRVVAATFAAGSVFFTSAGYSQFLQVLNQGSATFRYIGVKPRDMVWWAVTVQLAGTIFFNVSTFGALVQGLDTAEINRLVWAPDMFGSIAFLVASALAWASLVGFRWAVRTDDADWWINLVNAIGSVFFMLSAIAALTLPTTGEMANLTIVNAGTFFGAVCFLAGGYLLWPAAPRSERGLTQPARHGAARLRPTLVGALVSRRQRGRPLDPGHPRLGPLRLDDPPQNRLARRGRERVPVIPRRRMRLEGGREVVWYHEVLDVVEHRPGAVHLGALNGRQAGRRHESRLGEAFHAGLVAPCPAAARSARRVVQLAPLLVDGARSAVHPTEAECLLDRRLVVEDPCPVPFLQVTSQAPVAVAWFASSQARHSSRVSHWTEGSVVEGGHDPECRTATA